MNLFNALFGYSKKTLQDELKWHFNECLKFSLNKETITYLTSQLEAWNAQGKSVFQWFRETEDFFRRKRKSYNSYRWYHKKRYGRNIAKKTIDKYRYNSFKGKPKKTKEEIYETGRISALKYYYKNKKGIEYTDKQIQRMRLKKLSKPKYKKEKRVRIQLSPEERKENSRINKAIKYYKENYNTVYTREQIIAKLSKGRGYGGNEKLSEEEAKQRRREASLRWYYKKQAGNKNI